MVETFAFPTHSRRTSVPAFLETTVKELDRRLDELKDEMSKLEAARRALLVNGSAARRRDRKESESTATARPKKAPAKTGTSQRASTRRGRRGQRPKQALELVRASPGIAISDLAKAMKIQPSYLYRVMPGLAKEGKVIRDGKGWRAT
jgi:hypothetical protein